MTSMVSVSAYNGQIKENCMVYSSSTAAPEIQFESAMGEVKIKAMGRMGCVPAILTVMVSVSVELMPQVACWSLLRPACRLQHD